MYIQDTGTSVHLLRFAARLCTIRVCIGLFIYVQVLYCLLFGFSPKEGEIALFIAIERSKFRGEFCTRGWVGQNPRNATKAHATHD